MSNSHETIKARGYHAHYCRSIQGDAYTLEITTYPANNDI